MSINKNHPKSFFKYVTAKTAEIVLKNKTLRWSHPSEFDDTLDVGLQIVDKKMDDEKQIRDAMLDLAANFSFVYNANDTNKSFKFLVSLLSLHGNDKTSAISELKKVPVDISNITADLNKGWEEIRNDLRILCLSIEKDNHHLWNRYAENHKGVVIELTCREESDSPWFSAQPVEYVPEKDLFLTVDDLAEMLILEPIKAAERIFKKSVLRKVKENEQKWFEQNEWRIPSFCRHYETGTISDYGVNPNDFSAVYFGHKIDSETQDNLLSLLISELSHVSAFRCEFDSSKKITFRKIK